MYVNCVLNVCFYALCRDKWTRNCRLYVQISCSLVIHIHYYDWKPYDFPQSLQAFAKTLLLVHCDRP